MLSWFVACRLAPLISVAATDTGDKDGNDNGQLSLATNSLSASSLNTTSNNKSSSIGFDIALSNNNPAQTGKNGNTVSVAAIKLPVSWV
jgi:hypothetical protein